MRKPWIIAAVLLALLAGVTAGAQDKRESQLRTVRGDIVDRQDTPVKSATVYLKNMRTLTVQTHFSDESGAYRFSGLDPNVDYEVHAERDDSASATRTISSFDTRKEIVINLKLNKKKPPK